MVRVTTAEAMKLISSLAEQVLSSSSNSHREEFYPQSDKGLEYLSIAVLPTPIPVRQYGLHEMQEFDYGEILGACATPSKPKRKKTQKRKK